MFVVRDCEHVNAPAERCFQLATHLGLVAEMLEMTTVPGKGLRTEGFVAGGDRVLWKEWKFGMPQVHVSRITKFEPLVFFQEVMERGRFKRFEHDHHFKQVGEHTLVLDYVRFSMPVGLVGRAVGHSIVMPHVVKLVRKRMMMLKWLAESDGWQKYLPEGLPAEGGVVKAEAPIALQGRGN